MSEALILYRGRGGVDQESLKPTTITSNGNYVAPVTGNYMVYTVGGGGGGGGGCRNSWNSSQVFYGSGGSRGALNTKTVFLNAGDQVPITLGAGGSGGANNTTVVSNNSRGTNGSAGGTTIFGSYVSAESGTPGSYSWSYHYWFNREVWSNTIDRTNENVYFNGKHHFSNILFVKLITSHSAPRAASLITYKNGINRPICVPYFANNTYEYDKYGHHWSWTSPYMYHYTGLDKTYTSLQDSGWINGKSNFLVSEIRNLSKFDELQWNHRLKCKNGKWAGIEPIWLKDVYNYRTFEQAKVKLESVINSVIRNCGSEFTFSQIVLLNNYNPTINEEQNRNNYWRQYDMYFMHPEMQNWWAQYNPGSDYLLQLYNCPNSIIDNCLQTGYITNHWATIINHTWNNVFKGWNNQIINTTQNCYTSIQQGSWWYTSNNAISTSGTRTYRGDGGASGQAGNAGFILVIPPQS